MPVYRNLGTLKAATVPIVPTGAGALYQTNLGRDETGNSIPAPASEQLYNLARVSARGFVVRAVATFLYATGLLAFLAFLTTIKGADTDKMYITGLSVVINAVAVVHYKYICNIREFHIPVWLTGSTSSSDMWLPAENWNDQRAVAVEIMIDSLRHSDWLITMVFLTYKIYAIINRPFSDYNHSVFESVDAAAATAAVMILLGAIARVGTDEMWDIRNVRLLIFGFVCYGLSILCLCLLVVSMGVASADIEDGWLLRSFFYVWIGYPVVATIGIVYRLMRKCTDETEYTGQYPSGLSLFKDIAYGLLDAWSKGVFALWTAYTVFGVHLMGSPAAVPYAWP